MNVKPIQQAKTSSTTLVTPEFDSPLPGVYSVPMVEDEGVTIREYRCMYFEDDERFACGEPATVVEPNVGEPYFCGKHGRKVGLIRED